MNEKMLAGLLVLGGLMVMGDAIGDTIPEASGKTTNYSVVKSGEDSIVIMETEVRPFRVPPGAPGANSPYRTNKPALRLLMVTGKGGWVGKRVKGYRGPVYFAPDIPGSKIDQTNLVEILCTEDKTTIAAFVLDNGPLYYSTNSGVTWSIFSDAGQHEIPLTDIEKDGGLIAAATIRPRSNPTPQQTDKPSRQRWYAVTAGLNASKLVLTGGALASPPVLTIDRSGGNVVISWSSAYGTFVLQQDGDLTSPNWIDVTNSVHSALGQNQVTIASPPSNNFYRLRSP